MKAIKLFTTAALLSYCVELMAAEKGTEPLSSTGAPRESAAISVEGKEAVDETAILGNAERNVWAWAGVGVYPAVGRKRNLADLEPELFGEQARKEMSQKERHRRFRDESLYFKLMTLGDYLRRKSDRGFAIAGSGRELLEKTIEVLSGTRPPSNEFSTSDELAVVFLRDRNPLRFMLRGLELNADSILVMYEIHGPVDSMMNPGGAIIEIGKLKAGRYRIKYVRLPAETSDHVFEELAPSHAQTVPEGIEKEVVCREFAIVVREE